MGLGSWPPICRKQSNQPIESIGGCFFLSSNHRLEKIVRFVLAKERWIVRVLEYYNFVLFSEIRTLGFSNDAINEARSKVGKGRIVSDKMVTEQDNFSAIEIELEKAFLFLNLCGLNAKELLSHSSFELCEKSKFFFQIYALLRKL